MVPARGILFMYLLFRQKAAKKRKTPLSHLCKTCRRICGAMFAKSTFRAMLHNILLSHTSTSNTASSNGLGSSTTPSTKGLAKSNSASRKPFESIQTKTQSRALRQNSPTKSTCFLRGDNVCERRSCGLRSLLPYVFVLLGVSSCVCVWSWFELVSVEAPSCAVFEGMSHVPSAESVFVLDICTGSGS